MTGSLPSLHAADQCRRAGCLQNHSPVHRHPQRTAHKLPGHGVGVLASAQSRPVAATGWAVPSWPVWPPVIRAALSHGRPWDTIQGRELRPRWPQSQDWLGWTGQGLEAKG